MTKRVTAVLIIAFLIIGGCSLFKSKDERPANELADAGMQAYRDGRYKKAIENFEQLRDWYPFSKYAILAELKIADGYFKLEEFEDAAVAYEEFENLHPRNEAIPYVIYQIGRCHFDQIDTIDRDQGQTRRALETFQRLIERFPNDVYALKAREHERICYKSLAGHDLYVGKFYFKSRHYKAALGRFMSVVTDYPDVGIQYEALKYIAICQYAIQQELGALD
ncbi:MAG: outer membrane protein assembly factor BamD [Pseudomonadota bacterium]